MQPVNIPFLTPAYQWLSNHYLFTKKETLTYLSAGLVGVISNLVLNSKMVNSRWPISPQFRLSITVGLPTLLVILTKAISTLFRTRVQPVPQPHPPPQGWRPPVDLKLVQEPLAPLAPLPPADPHSYLSLLPAELLLKTGTLLPYATHQAIQSQPITEKGLALLNQGLRFVDAGDVARSLLEAENIPFCPHFGESAIEHLKRHEALFAPESRLFQPNPHILRAKKLAVSGHLMQFSGPVLVIKENDELVAYHWPTGRHLWTQSNPHLSKRLNLCTGTPFTPHAPLEIQVNDQFEHLELTDRRRIFNHTRNQEIVLNNDCNARYGFNYRFPYLLYRSTQGIWLKKGDEPEILTQASSHILSFASCIFSPPYFFNAQGVFSLETGQCVLAFPAQFDRPICFFKPDTFLYGTTRDGFNPIPSYSLFSLQNGEQTAPRFFSSSHHVCRTQGSFILQLSDELVLEDGKNICFYHPLRGYQRHQIQGFQNMDHCCFGIYNSYLFIYHAELNNFSYYVIDLAEQSLNAQPL